MRHLLAVTCFLLLLTENRAQIVNNNWYFGYGTDGLTFTTAGPQKVSDKRYQVGFEGVIVVNDPLTGALLFYSDGRQVINKNHQVMNNGAGLYGHESGAQCVQCCPIPGSCGKKFYLFTNSAWDEHSGFIYYSIVDFTNNTLGEVTDKNVQIYTGYSDQAMCLINKPNTTDYWLCATAFDSNGFWVWPVTASGIGGLKAYSFTATGTTYQMNYSEQAGKIIVTGFTGTRSLTMITFNASSGIPGSEENLGKDDGWGFFGGARFSPDGTKLYASRMLDRSLYQYDFITRTFTNMNTCCYAHDLKMGPDGKMYFIHTYYSTQPISVIDFPNETAVGNKCNYHALTFPVAFNGEVRRFPEIVTLPTPPAAHTDSSDFTGAPLIMDVLNNDNDPLGLTLSIDAITSPPKYGTAAIVSGKITYSSNSKLCRFRDSLIYRISNTNCQSDTAWLIFKKTSPPIITSGSLTICNGESFEGHTSSGTYNHTYVTALGCDSIRTTVLTVSPPIQTSITASVCEGQAYEGHSTSGSFTDHFTAVNGCDSARILKLTVMPASKTTITAAVCAGEVYEGYSTTGIYVDHFTAITGCDSIRTLLLTVYQPVSTEISNIICAGQNYAGYTVTGTYTDKLKSAAGCDSTRTLHLTVLPNIATTRAVSICEGQSYREHNTSGAFQYKYKAANGCDSIETIQLTVKPRATSLYTATICEGENFMGYTQTGTYKDVFVAANGCDSTRTIYLTVKPVSKTIIDTTICTGSSYAGYTAAGEYVDAFKNSTGCDSIRILYLHVTRFSLPALGNDTIICTGNTLPLYPGRFDTYRWQDGTAAGTYIAKGAGHYSVAVSNRCGSWNAAINIREKSCRIYFPDAFTPNKDGRNDLFHILTEQHLISYHLLIYNRWGQKIFETTDYTRGWDGTWQGLQAVPGSYVWYCEYVSPIENKNLKGTVILIR